VNCLKSEMEIEINMSKNELIVHYKYMFIRNQC